MSTGNESEAIHVVAGVLIDAAGRVLLAQRPAGKHMAGCWEFPGGKVERGEDPVDALRRELIEEIGVRIGKAEPLIQVPWEYPEKRILLDIYKVSQFSGPPQSREGQALKWSSIDALDPATMPAADHPAINALRLPPCYLITPEPGLDLDRFLRDLGAALATGVCLVQLRAKSLPDTALRELARRAHALTKDAGASLLINGRIDLAVAMNLDGVHVTANQLRHLQHRPVSARQWFAASCHDAEEIALASQLGADFITLSPVRPTQTHASTEALGWDQFAQLCKRSTVPVYPLGGMLRSDLERAKRLGGQGIAAIRGLW
ncbi:MAG: Nudix family hydrolase [Tahibacter sp.]